MFTRRQGFIMLIALIFAGFIGYTTYQVTAINKAKAPVEQPAVQHTEAAIHAVQSETTPARYVAERLNCHSFRDLWKANTFGMTDDGVCWMHGKKFAVNTFTGPKFRDAWLEYARPLGVIPHWMSATAVVYPSTNS